MTFPSPFQLLKQYQLAPKHSFGQNFLCDAHLTEKIARAAVHDTEENVVEIGAGLGALTDALLARAARVTVVERDRELVPVLHQIFAESKASGRLFVVEADAKRVDYLQLFSDMDPNPLAPRVLAGNLPYQITGPLLQTTVALGRHLQRAVFLVQKEVADRLAARPGTKDYGALTVFVQAQFSVERAFLIKPGAFHPRPRVDSAVVVLTPRATPVAEETPVFRQVVKSAFLGRRKTLRNAWKSLLPGEVLREAATKAGVQLDVRGETLSPMDFANMAREVQAHREEEQRAGRDPS